MVCLLLNGLTHTHARLKRSLEALPAGVKKTAIISVFNRVYAPRAADTKMKGGQKLLTVQQCAKGFPEFSVMGAMIKYGDARTAERVHKPVIPGLAGVADYILTLRQLNGNAPDFRAMKFMEVAEFGQMFLDTLPQQMAACFHVLSWFGNDANVRDDTARIKVKAGHGKREQWSADNYQSWTADDAFLFYDVCGLNVVTAHGASADALLNNAVANPPHAANGYDLAVLQRIAIRCYRLLNPTAQDGRTCPVGEVAFVDTAT